MSCDCQLIIKENDDDDDEPGSAAFPRVLLFRLLQKRTSLNQ